MTTVLGLTPVDPLCVHHQHQIISRKAAKWPSRHRGTAVATQKRNSPAPHSVDRGSEKMHRPAGRRLQRSNRETTIPDA
jgi:hypothetical protein